jgi:predicted transcriptional regulator
MDKVFSARMDESVLRRIHDLAQRMGTSKKAVLENAVRAYAEQHDREQGTNVLKATFGAWRRKEKPEATVAKARRAFRRSMERRQ